MEHEHEPFSWFQGFPAPLRPAITAALVAVVLIAFAIRVRGKLAATEQALEPDPGFSARNLAEAFVEAITGMTEGVIGHHAEQYVPLLASFFAFILLGNLLGLVPGFAPPTSDFHVTFALGMISFVMYHYYGIRSNGAGKYIKHFLGPVMLLAPLMFVVEMFSNAFRPISLGIRLYANMFADHQVIEIFTDKTKFLVPVIFYVLGAFVSVVQAFVFTMLSAIYIALGLAHEAHEEH
jgi:F-type H+-transporting ATPase subunit a